MDVIDRPLRVDVPPVVPSSPDSAAPSPAPSSNGPSFADSLQRTQPRSDADSAGPAKNPRPNAATDNGSGPPTAPTNARDSAPSAAVPDTSPAPKTNVPGDAAAAAKTPPSSDVALDETVDASQVANNLVAGLVAVVNPAPLPPPPAAPVVEQPPIVLPASLVKAIQSPSPMDQTASAAPPPAAIPVEPPSMPSGLQAGLTPRNNATQPASPHAQIVPPLTETNESTPAPATTTVVVLASQGVPAPSTPAPKPPLSAPVAALPAVSPDSTPTTTSTPIESLPPAPMASHDESAGSKQPAAKSQTPAVDEPAKPLTAPSAALNFAAPAPVAIPAPPHPSADHRPGAPAGSKQKTGVEPLQTESSVSADVVTNPPNVTPHRETTAPSSAPAPTPAYSDVFSSGNNEASNVPVPSVVEQIHPKLQQAVFHDRNLTMTLRPPELGSVTIEIVRHEGVMTARLQTETATAHQLLTDHLPQLRETLTQWGLTGDQVQIVRAEASQSEGGTSLRSGGNPASGQGQSGSRQESPQQAPPQLPLSEESERDEPPAPQFIRSRTAINLRI